MPTRGRRPPQVLITSRDAAVLGMAAEHRLILPDHAAALLGVAPTTAGGRLRALAQAGYLARHRIFAGQPPCFQITQRGLDAIGCDLPRPHVDLRAYAHDIGLAWLWLEAHRGSLGRVSEVISERTLRSRDGHGQGVGADARTSGSELLGIPGGSEPLGIRLGGAGPRGRLRLHYPDLLLITREQRRVAVELELSSKGRARRDRILAGYGADARIDAVLYLVDRPAVGQAIRSTARRLGLSSLVHVQRLGRPESAAVGAGRVAERTPPGRER